MHSKRLLAWGVATLAAATIPAAAEERPELPPLHAESGAEDGAADEAIPGMIESSREAAARAGGPADALLAALQPPALAEVAAEVLSRSPEIARARRLAAAAAARAPRVRALPDPVAALTLFVLPPETRVGPQRFTASIQQKLPWFGKLPLAEQEALYAAAAAEAEVESMRLEKLTEARRLVYELAFLEAQRAAVAAERGALVRYERAAQGRYASGTGLQQEIVRIQTQITRVDTRLLEISERRAALAAALNALRDRPADTQMEVPPLTAMPEPAFDREELLRQARAHRPELAAAEARIAAGGSRVELAEKSFRPDFTFGLAYTLVGRRDDEPGRIDPPASNGDDILALTGSLELPVRRRKLAAGLAEAQALRQAEEEAKRQILAEIEGTIGDLAARIPLLHQHLRLLDNVLLKQAREALRSAETAYSTGKLNAIDLLDAEVVLFEVRIAAERTRADLAVAWAELEHAAAYPLPPHLPAELPKESPTHDQ